MHNFAGGPSQTAVHQHETIFSIDYFSLRSRPEPLNPLKFNPPAPAINRSSSSHFTSLWSERGLPSKPGLCIIQDLGSLLGACFYFLPWFLICPPPQLGWRNPFFECLIEELWDLNWNTVTGVKCMNPDSRRLQWIGLSVEVWPADWKRRERDGEAEGNIRLVVKAVIWSAIDGEQLSIEAEGRRSGSARDGSEGGFDSWSSCWWKAFPSNRNKPAGCLLIFPSFSLIREYLLSLTSSHKWIEIKRNICLFLSSPCFTQMLKTCCHLHWRHARPFPLQRQYCFNRGCQMWGSHF